MRRSDRLFELIGLIRDGRLHKAADLARRLEVSPRTLYRDMATLQASGLPIEGERGVGYILRAPIALAPVALNEAERAAFRLAIALLGGGADPVTAGAAASLARKLSQAGGGVPEIPGEAIYVHGSEILRRGMAWIAPLRAAISGRERLAIRYLSLGGEESSRIIRPLQLEFWGQVWTCGAWCELRRDFRVFRLDRIAELGPEGSRFPEEPGRGLAEYRARIAAQAG